MWREKRLIAGWIIAGVSQNINAQIDSISTDMRKKIQENFALYKKYIPYPHDTIHINTSDIEENIYQKESNIKTIAIAEWHGQITINRQAKPEDISTHVILHELTHTLKDTTSTNIKPYILQDAASIIGVNGLTFDILLPNKEIVKFAHIEEAIAEYIAYNITQEEQFTDPSYYALGYFMRSLAKHTNTSIQDLAQAIENDDYKYILELLSIAEDPMRGDILFSMFQQISDLGIWQVSYKNIQSRVNRRTKNHLWF